MTLASTMFPIGMAGFLFMILAVQLRLGFPPFYKPLNLFPFMSNFEKKEEFERITYFLPAFVLAMIVLSIPFIFTKSPIVFLVFGSLGVWGGLKARRALSREVGGPLPWLITYFPYLSRNWPMFVFDMWTVGISLIVGAVMLLS